MKCVNCKNCVNTFEIEGIRYYLCKIGEDIEAVEECVANDENLGCDLYVEDRDDDFTARS